MSVLISRVGEIVLFRTNNREVPAIITEDDRREFDDVVRLVVFGYHATYCTLAAFSTARKPDTWFFLHPSPGSFEINDEILRVHNSAAKFDADWLMMRIREILRESSGGMKFLEFMTKLQDREQGWTFNMTADSVVALIGRMPDVEILNYTWHDCNRAKMFVYTP